MTISDPTKDFLSDDSDQPKKIPEMLNVLTILTYVGCGVGLIFTIWGFIGAKKSYDAVIQMQTSMDSAPAWAKRLAGPDMVEIARKTYENRVPIVALGLIGLALCFFGAKQMRELKKQGFMLWVIGEILPVLSSFIFIGMVAFGGFASFLGLLFPLAFIIMYASQRKYMVN
jgi:hypothetical protein